MSRSVVITGIGTLTPAGRGLETLWDHVCSGLSALTPIDPATYFDPSSFRCHLAGQVQSIPPHELLTERFRAQTDRCAQLALIAACDALQAAHLPFGFLPVVDPERVALMIGTVLGGVTSIEQGMRAFWTRGSQGVDRYAETAGFILGTQGQLSILLGVRGRAQTFVSERVCSAHALIEGANMIQRGLAEVVIAGGTEAPITALAWSAYQSQQMLALTRDLEPPYSYRPYDDKKQGMIIGEGSTFIILEERDHAVQRSVPILAEIRGWGRGIDPVPLDRTKRAGESNRPVFARTIIKSFEQAKIHIEDIDVVFAHGSGLAAEDEAERVALQTLFGSRFVPLTVPKVCFGHLQGAATPTDVAIAVQACLHRTIPPTLSAENQAESAESRALVSPLPCSIDIQHSLILAGGLGGVHACLVVSRDPAP